MHIPDQMLNGTICPVTAVVSVVGVTAAVIAAKAKEKPTPLKFAAVTALIFSLQMMNFPVQSGTSGHFVGAMLAAMLLGPSFAILSMAAILAIQALVFADGGILTLGANILVMGFVGVIPAIVLKWLTEGKAFSGATRRTMLFVSSWLSVVLASFACSLLLGISGTIEFKEVIIAMVGIHSLIGIGEGLITLLAMEALASSFAQKRERISLWLSATLAAVVASLLSPYASKFPDGLEWVAEKYNFLSRTAVSYISSPLPDYKAPFIADPHLSTAVAGAIGVVVTFSAIMMLGTLLKKVEPKI